MGCGRSPRQAFSCGSWLKNKLFSHFVMYSLHGLDEAFVAIFHQARAAGDFAQADAEIAADGALRMSLGQGRQELPAPLDFFDFRGGQQTLQKDL